MNIFISETVSAMNGREKALIAWVFFAFVFILFSSKTRQAFWGVVKAFLNKKIIIPLLAAFVYSGVSIWILRFAGVWNITLLKDTIFWLLGTATVLFFNVDKASRSSSLFKKMLLETVAFTVFLEFLAGLYSFSFLVEFFSMPLLFLIVGMSALADGRDEYKVARKPLKAILAGYGLFMLSYSVLTALGNLAESITIYNLLTLIVPSVLTVMYLPFVYVFALIMAYETLFVRLKAFIKSKKLLTFAKREIFTLCLFNLRLLNEFSQSTGGGILRIKSRQDVLNMIKDFKEQYV